AVPCEEKFNAQHAHHIQRLENSSRNLNSLARDLRLNPCRRDRYVQNVIAVLVLNGSVVHEPAVDTSRGDDAQLASKIDKCFQYRFLPAYEIPASVDFRL